MVNVAVFFGGESCEHDISVVTGEQLIDKINKHLYNIIPIFVNKNGEWLVGENLNDIDNIPNNLGKTMSVGFIPNDNTLYYKKGKILKKYITIDVAILCLHGGTGEDGSVAGVLELSKIPYSSCGVASSAVCLDKIIFNYVASGIGINKLPYMTMFLKDYENDKLSSIAQIKDFGLPVIIKPARLGSSIGINIVKSEKDLQSMLEKSFEYDNRLLIEKFINVEKEINIACFYHKGELVFSKSEEPISNDEYLSFDDKYLKSSGAFETMKRQIPANISNKQLEEIKTIAEKLYYLLDMSGVVRYDFLYSEGKIYLNEVNTIPGSMANYLFLDISYPKFIEMLISSALLRLENKSKLKKSYESEVLKNGILGIKK